ncbi:MAG: hypothetical protein HOP11_14700 [Saprospiraceae bacterium]|nr:hypothetical protein [Saprospiraceae bacterium]
MKTFIYITVIFLFASCTHKLPRTSDFILYEESQKKLVARLNINSDFIANETKTHKSIYMSGIRWEDRNFEGTKYHLPVICDNYDLDAFLNGEKMRINRVEQQNTKIKILTNERQSKVDKEIETLPSDPTLAESKMVQFSYLYFIDPCRVVFVSNPRVKYDKNYNPIIKNEFEELELSSIHSKTKYTRGYYVWENVNTLKVELRPSMKEPSSILYFNKINKDGDLSLVKIILYKYKKVENNDNPYVKHIQVIDKEVGLLENFPDIISEPKAYRIPKEIKLKINNQPIKSITYENIHPGNTSIGAATHTKLIRKYELQDSTQLELLDWEKCLSW